MKLPFFAFSMLLVLGAASFVRADDSLWKNAHQSPTPIPPPQIAPLKEDLEGKPTPTPVVAPLIVEPSEKPTPVPGKNLKKPVTAGLLSAILPGSGHFYTGEPVKGLFFATAFSLTLWQSIRNFQQLPGTFQEKNATAGQLYGLAALVSYGFCVQDAFDSARRHNRKYHLIVSLDNNTGPFARMALAF